MPEPSKEELNEFIKLLQPLSETIKNKLITCSFAEDVTIAKISDAVKNHVNLFANGECIKDEHIVKGWDQLLAEL